MILSDEELNLFNPAFVGLVIYNAVRDFQGENGEGMDCSLLYLVVPISMSKRYSSSLPGSVMTPFGSWITQNQGELLNFAEVAGSYIDIVNSSLAYLLSHSEIRLNEHDSTLQIYDDKLPKKPALIQKNARLKEIISSACFLGRWFAKESSVSNVYAQLGVRP